MKRLQNIFTKVHFGQGGSSGDPTLIFHFSQDGKLIMAEIMNRNYRSAPSSPNRTRNLSLVKKFSKYFYLIKYSNFITKNNENCFIIFGCKKETSVYVKKES